MAYIVILIAISIFSWLTLGKFKSTAPDKRARLLRQWLFIGLALVVVLLTVTGRLHWVGAAIALAVAIASQLWKLFSRLLPWALPFFIKRMRTTQQEPPSPESAAQQPESPALTPEEAQCILNVSKDANRDEIIVAHRKLIQKFHPDQGGNHYLASRINAAKELLIKEL